MPRNRKNEIVDAALRLTAEGGIQNLTVKKISAAVGVTEPALYRHFQNKSEIVKAMIGRFDFAVPVEDIHGAEGVRAFLTARFFQVAETPELARVMFAEELFMDDSEFVELMRSMMHRHKAALGKALAESRKNGELRSEISPEMMFWILLGPVRLLIKQWGMSGGAFDLKQKGNELLETLFSLLKSENRDGKGGSQ